MEARVARDTHTPLDGTFLAWANPPTGAKTGGDYPFAFDCPDADTVGDLALPTVVDAQIAAFAQEVSVFDTEARYAASDSARVTAWSWLGRYFAMFTDKSQVEIRGLADRIAAMGEDEVKEILALDEDEIVARFTGVTGTVGHA